MISKFEFKPLSLTGAYLIKAFSANDIRGALIKDYSKEIFNDNGINYDLKEVFYTISHKGVIRAIHFQNVKQQAKLVRCISGKIYDVIVDLRKDSPTYGQHLGFYLTGDNHIEILVPEGFGHGYLVLEESIVSYKCAEKFYGEYDSGIMWNDHKLNIKWPLEQLDCEVVLADKDKNLQSFDEFDEYNENKYL